MKRWLLEATKDFTPGLVSMALTMILSGTLALLVRHGTVSPTPETSIGSSEPKESRVAG